MNLKIFFAMAVIVNLLLFVTQSTPFLTKIVFLISYLAFVVLIAKDNGLVLGFLMGFALTCMAATPAAFFLKSNPSMQSGTVCETGIGGQMFCHEEY